MEQKENKIISPPINTCTQKPLNCKWEKCLEDYNNYTKEYIKHYTKALQGDTISLSLYPYMKLRSEVLYEHLFDAQQKSLLTEKQIKKMLEIQIENSFLIK